MSKSSKAIILSTALLLGFAANVQAGLPDGVTCTGKHKKGNGVCYDGCSKNGSKITGNYGVDGLWHDGLCGSIVKKPPVKDAAVKDQATPDQNVTVPAQ